VFFRLIVCKVVSLGTGQAILFSPNGLAIRSNDDDDEALHNLVTPIGQGYLVVRSRLRITRDGGHSLLAVQDPLHSSRLPRVHDQNAPPPMVVTAFPSKISRPAEPKTFLSHENTSFATGLASTSNDWIRLANNPPAVNAMVARAVENPDVYPPSIAGQAISAGDENAFPVVDDRPISDFRPTSQSWNLPISTDPTSSDHDHRSQPGSPQQAYPNPPMESPDDSARFEPLLKVLKRLHRQGRSVVPWGDIWWFQKSHPEALGPKKRIGAYIEDAARLGLIEILPDKHMSLPSTSNPATAVVSPVTSAIMIAGNAPPETGAPIPQLNAAVDANSEDSEDDDEPIEPASAAAAPIQTNTIPLMKLMMDGSKRGEHRFGQKYVIKNIQKSYGKKSKGRQGAKAAINYAVSIGLLVQDVTPIGSWLYLPPAEPGALSFGSRVADEDLYVWQSQGIINTSHSVYGVVPNLLTPIIKFIRHQNNRSVLLKKLIKHFRNLVPSEPYGDKRAMMIRLLDYATQLGLVLCTGTGKKTTVELLATVSA
jgi:hypothetical protein